MTQPAPGYQPYQPPPPMMGYAPPPKASGGGLTSMLAGILALVTAALAIGGSFAPITSFRDSYQSDGDPFVSASSYGWWGYTDNGSTEPLDAESSLIGLALVLVATLLVLGAVFAFVASRTRTSGPTAGGRSLISAGVGVLTGVMLLQLMSVLEQASTFNDRELDAGESLDFKPGLGLILPLGALGLGLVAVVLAHVGQRPRLARVEPNTPRMGFPAPYGYQMQGVPVTPAAPSAPTAPASDAEVGSEATDDADDTQRVSNATATGAEPVTPPAPAAVTPPAETPPTPTVAAPAPATSGHTAPKSDPTPEDPAPVTPSSTATTAEAPPAPTPEAPAAPAGDAPAAPSDAEPTPLTDLPAAPPAPELTDEKKDDK